MDTALPIIKRLRNDDPAPAKWLDVPTLRLDDLGKRAAAARVARGLKGLIDNDRDMAFARSE
jgi:hypothetical protein